MSGDLMAGSDQGVSCKQFARYRCDCSLLCSRSRDRERL